MLSKCTVQQQKLRTASSTEGLFNISSNRVYHSSVCGDSIEYQIEN